MCHISHLKAGKPEPSQPPTSPTHPSTPKIHDGKCCFDFDFPQLLGGFPEMLLPNSRLLCDAEGMLEKSKRQRIPILHPLFGKVDDAGKKLQKPPAWRGCDATEHMLHSSRHNCFISFDENAALNNLQSVVDHHWSSSEGRKLLCC